MTGYKVKKHYIYGYAILPCFKMKVMKGSECAEADWSKPIELLWYLFCPFWNGCITVTGEGDEE